MKVQGFKAELKKAGIASPNDVSWVFRVLDELPPELVEGTRLATYAEARAKAAQACDLLTAAEELLSVDSFVRKTNFQFVFLNRLSLT